MKTHRCEVELHQAHDGAEGGMVLRIGAVVPGIPHSPGSFALLLAEQILGRHTNDAHQSCVHHVIILYI